MTASFFVLILLLSRILVRASAPLLPPGEAPLESASPTKRAHALADLQAQLELRPRVLIRAYPGRDQADVTELFRAEVESLADRGYRPTSQNWVQGQVDIRPRGYGERWLAVAEISGDPEVGLGATARQAIRAALVSLGAQARSELMADPSLLTVSRRFRPLGGRRRPPAEV